MGIELCNPQREELLDLQRGEKRIGEGLTSGEGYYRPDLTVYFGDEGTARGDLLFRQPRDPFDRGFVGPVREPYRDRSRRSKSGRTRFSRA